MVPGGARKPLTGAVAFVAAKLLDLLVLLAVVSRKTACLFFRPSDFAIHKTFQSFIVFVTGMSSTVQLTETGREILDDFHRWLNPTGELLQDRTTIKILLAFWKLRASDLRALEDDGQVFKYVEEFKLSETSHDLLTKLLFHIHWPLGLDDSLSRAFCRLLLYTKQPLVLDEAWEYLCQHGSRNHFAGSNRLGLLLPPDVFEVFKQGAQGKSGDHPVADAIGAFVAAIVTRVRKSAGDQSEQVLAARMKTALDAVGNQDTGLNKAVFCIFDLPPEDKLMLERAAPRQSRNHLAALIVQEVRSPPPEELPAPPTLPSPVPGGGGKRRR